MNVFTLQDFHKFHQKSASFFIQMFKKSRMSYLPSAFGCNLQKIILAVLILITLSKLSTTAAHHRLRKVPSKVRVQDCYIVHIFPKVQWTEAEELIQELEELGEDASHPNFSAQVVGKMVKLVFGFAVKLSPEALEYVS